MPKADTAIIDRLNRLDFNVAGLVKPAINVSELTEGAVPANLVFVRHDLSLRDVANSQQHQRIVDTTRGGQGLGTNMRVVTVISNTACAAPEYAISGEISNYSNVASIGVAAVSGTSFKYGLAPIFAGHFQANDMFKFGAATLVTALVGVEINTPAIGLDHPTLNNGTGLRRCLEIIARTNQNIAGWDTATGNYGEAEIGVGVHIRTDNATGGHFRYGALIDDVSQVNNPNSIGTGIFVRTSGEYGIRLGSSNTGAAISLPSGARLEMGINGGERVAMVYSNSANGLQFQKDAVTQFGFNFGAAAAILINTVQVVRGRRTGWSVATGTKTRTSFNTATATLQDVAERLGALIDDLHGTAGHGLIGT